MFRSRLERFSNVKLTIHHESLQYVMRTTALPAQCRPTKVNSMAYYTNRRASGAHILYSDTREFTADIGAPLNVKNRNQKEEERKRTRNSQDQPPRLGIEQLPPLRGVRLPKN